MAAIVALVRRRDFSADISSLSLFNYEDGFSLTRDGWIQAAAGGDDRVSEAMTLHVKGSSHDDLAVKLQLLDDKIREVGWYSDAVEQYGIWLRAQMPDENRARQALVTDMRCEPSVSFYAPPAAPGNWLRAGYNLALERMPWWEDDGFLALNSDSMNCLGGSWNYALTGNIPARIMSTVFQGVVGSGPMYEFWMGFRTDRMGDLDNFVSVWECEDGSASSPTHYDSSVASDSDARGGSKVECTFATQAGMKPRFTVAIEDVTSNAIDQRGSFNIVMRAKIDSGTVCRLRLLDGFKDADDWRTQPRVAVSSDSFFLYSLGTVNFPPARSRPLAYSLNKCALRIEAERVSGSGNLHLDCLTLIPCAEGAIHFSGCAVENDPGTTNNKAYILTHPDGTMSGYAYTGSSPTAALSVESQRYAMPVGNGQVIMAGQRETQQVLDDLMLIGYAAARRWRTLRGDV